MKRKGRSNERDNKELKRKDGSNEWKERAATKGRMQRKDGRNEMDELTGKEEQDERGRRFERKDGHQEHFARYSSLSFRLPFCSLHRSFPF